MILILMYFFLQTGFIPLYSMKMAELVKVNPKQLSPVKNMLISNFKVTSLTGSPPKLPSIKDDQQKKISPEKQAGFVMLSIFNAMKADVVYNTKEDCVAKKSWLKAPGVCVFSQNSPQSKKNKQTHPQNKTLILSSLKITIQVPFSQRRFFEMFDRDYAIFSIDVRPQETTYQKFCHIEYHNENGSHDNQLIVSHFNTFEKGDLSIVISCLNDPSLKFSANAHLALYKFLKKLFCALLNNNWQDSEFPQSFVIVIDAADFMVLMNNNVIANSDGLRLLGYGDYPVDLQEPEKPTIPNVSNANKWMTSIKTFWNGHPKIYVTMSILAAFVVLWEAFFKGLF